MKIIKIVDMPFIENQEDNSINVISNQEHLEFKAEIMQYTNPCKYGIDRGRIAKLSIFSNDGECLAKYDAKWEILPKEEVKVFYNDIIKQFN